MPITNKIELKEYMAADLQVQPASRSLIKRLLFDGVVRLKKHLRFAEYHFNAGGGGSINCCMDIICCGFIIFAELIIPRFLLIRLAKD